MESTENNIERFTPRLEFVFSVPKEIERLKNTLGKLEWYQKEGYRPSFPKNLDLENPTLQGLEESVSIEYDPVAYERIKSEIEKLWKEQSVVFLQNLRTLGLPIQERYSVTLTRYGVGGSYHLPNQIIINFEKTSNLLKTTFHEIIHLTLQELIEKYNIEHWTKERLINLIHGKIYPEHTGLQKDPSNAEKVQEIFDKHFPDMKKVTEEISKIKN